MMTDNIINELIQEPEPKPGFGLSPGTIFLTVAILVAAAIFGVTLARRGETQPRSGPAPDFPIETFDGETLMLSDLKGSIVILNFWASWCAPCRAEAPALQNTWENYRDRGVIVLGVAYADNGPKSLEFIDEFGMTYPNAPDLGTRISEAYHIQGVPETFVIDREGNIHRFIISVVTETMLSDILDEMLAAEQRG